MLHLPYGTIRRSAIIKEVDAAFTTGAPPIDLGANIDQLNSDNITTGWARSVNVCPRERFCYAHTIKSLDKKRAILVQEWLVGRSSTELLFLPSYRLDTLPVWF